jgi:hypothetical protein
LLDGGPVLCDFVIPSLLSKEFNEGAGGRLLIVILLFNIYSKILFYLYLILFNIN